MALEFCRTSISWELVERCLIALIAVTRSFRGKAAQALRRPEGLSAFGNDHASKVAHG